MALTTTFKNLINRPLALINLKLDSLTVERAEQQRVQGLDQRGTLGAPLYPNLPDIDRSYLDAIAELYNDVVSDIDRLKQTGGDVGFDSNNTFFNTPDLEALYLAVRLLKPGKILEIGCGNSSRISRQAIIDGKLSTRLLAIDPQPRIDIEGIVDEFTQTRLEDVEDEDIVTNLVAGDFLFIDSSHQVRVGNDVARAFGRLLPDLARGVVVHFHDIFLPYEYPQDFAFNYPDWGEQYLLHAYLLHSTSQLLWPGYMLQQTEPELVDRLPFLASGRAQSFWFRQ